MSNKPMSRKDVISGLQDVINDLQLRRAKAEPLDHAHLGYMMAVCISAKQLLKEVD